MILLIDNYDSFVYNLYQLIGSLEEDILVMRNDEIDINKIQALSPSHIVISPGPGTPSQAGLCKELIQAFKGKIPILGVCLGHQIIAEYFGATVNSAKQIVHGKAHYIKIIKKSKIFSSLAETFKVARYHSLAIDTSNRMPECLAITAIAEDGEIMAIEHKLYRIFGVQFHPESILSEHGKDIIRNFLNIRGGIND